MNSATAITTTADILALEGAGWEADLGEMRDDPPDRKWLEPRE
ncbi:hypothetical protein ACFORH_00715 [Amycolatopsis roodepoortensis]|uniref:Uncharacterized protein n=1 Tax=Amycolatopsis roodepoortensis TaxID=700274 RepID=A0ABR9L4L0_9PSEU|nr:hypothetical protein [Amycolatopsis roodepoortensis]MBE1575511.1 hypothetical protein [Amycolatopsis roodepoortensis]